MLSSKSPACTGEHKNTGTGAALLIAMAACLASAPVAALEKCESFTKVREQIDIVVKTDPAKSAKFQSEVKSGADSLAVIEQLSPPEMEHQLDVCRYEAIEYLAKLGFAPAH